MVEVFPGSLLIADPFLKDPNFMRSVVFMCEHKEEGSFGFLLNQQYNYSLGQLIAGLEHIEFPVYVGGPVQKDTIHFLHQKPALIPGGIEVTDGIYWGGEFESVKDLLLNKKIGRLDIKFFIGYSGWGQGQLEQEMNEKSWLTTTGTRKLLFSTSAINAWKEALKHKGGEFSQLVNYPIDPQLN